MTDNPLSKETKKMFNPKMGAKVGANAPMGMGGAAGNYGVFGGGACASCGTDRADQLTVLGLDGTLQVAPLGVQVGTNSDFPNQSGAAAGQAPNATQGFNLNDNGANGTLMAFVMTFTPNCAIRIRGFYLPSYLANDIQLAAVYCGWTGYQSKSNLLTGRPAANLSDSNFIPGELFTQLNQTVPNFQKIDAVFTNTAPAIFVGRTRGKSASLVLEGALVAEAV